MGGSDCIVSFILLFAGTFVAIVLLKDQSRAETAQIVPLPQIGGDASSHGPWPACLGLEGTECQSLIEAKAPDAIVEIIQPGGEPVNPFSTHRVQIFVDNNGIVILPTPQRG